MKICHRLRQMVNQAPISHSHQLRQLHRLHLHRRQHHCSHFHWPHRSVRKMKNWKSFWTIRITHTIRVKRFVEPLHWIASKRKKFAVSQNEMNPLWIFYWVRVNLFKWKRTHLPFDVGEKNGLNLAKMT